MTSPRTTFVVTIGQFPLAAASSLSVAQEYAQQRDGKHAAEGTETQWEKQRPAEWRLMSRTPGHRRFAWTQYAVHAVTAL